MKWGGVTAFKDLESTPNALFPMQIDKVPSYSVMIFLFYQFRLEGHEMSRS